MIKFIIGLFAFCIVFTLVNSVIFAKTNNELPPGITKFQDGNVTCYISKYGTGNSISCVYNFDYL